MRRRIEYTWNLRELMAARGMYNMSDLLPLLSDYGIDLSASQLYRLLGEKPERMNFLLVHTILEVLDCDFAELSARTVVSTPARLKATGTELGTPPTGAYPPTWNMTHVDKTCSRCNREGVKIATTWPEGRVCRRCYQRATRIHGECPMCHTHRLLPGLAGGVPACVDCTGIPKDFHCARCGREDEPVRRGRCAHCCLEDDLSILLSGPDGKIPQALHPLYRALTTQRHARSATVWLTVNKSARTLLRDLAIGAVPLAHETFTEHPEAKKVAFLRQLAMEHGLIEPVFLDIERFDSWVLNAVGPLPRRDAQWVTQFARWFHRPKMEALAESGSLKKGTFLNAKQSVTAAVGFVRFVRERGRAGSECVQEDIDAWLSGPTTRSHARTFVRWSVKNGHLARVVFPYRVAKTEPILSQDQRLHLLRAVALDPVLEVDVRLSALLLLLYGQPLTRVARMALDQVAISGDRVSVRFSEQEVVVPFPFDNLIRAHVRALPNLNTSAHRENAWLFPGRAPGQHIHQSSVMNRLRDRGIDLRAARNSSLRALVLEMPAPLAADALGFSYQVADRHRVRGGATYFDYVSLRAKDQRSSNARD